MLKVGLTGNIASGKSTVADVWSELGALVIDADELARRAVEPGSPALEQIVERWGSGVLAPSGRLDRAALRDIVFRDAPARASLEAIVHPRVAALRDEEIASARARGAAVVVADIPLLFEVGLQDDFDVVVFVDAPPELRRDRIVRHRGIAPEEADRMIRAQKPAEEKRPLADILIANEGSLDSLREEARRVWRIIAEKAETQS